MAIGQSRESMLGQQNTSLSMADSTMSRESSPCSSRLLTSDLTFDTRAEMPRDFVPLVENVRWGTKGVLYRVKNYHTTLDSLPPRLHLLLRKSGRLVAGRIAIRKSLSSANELIDAFYHSLFSVHPAEQGKGYGKLLAHLTLGHLERLLKRPGLIYAYIEEGNLRSATIAASIGYRRFGQFYAHTIGFLSPKPSSRVGPLDDREKYFVQRLLQQRYMGHALTDFSLSFKAGAYWVLRERGSLIAGVQVCPQVWQIEQLPGLSGTIALKVLPRVPRLRDLFNPSEWRFLKIGNIYFQPGRPEALFELLEDVLYQYQMKTAALYIDHRSPIY